ncbi:MAG: VWA domain-containing protein [Candidatus Hydrogenedentes bacterium]|nr:VWA domain-containing protein [Candidatus Hydrogenedentota bacterium]
MSVADFLFFDTLEMPVFLLLLIGVALLLGVELFARTPGAINISTGETLAALPKSGRAHLRHVPALLRALGLACLVVALAGPLNGFKVRKDRANVIDIMLSVDVSGSMGQQDFSDGARRLSRLDVTKAAVNDFIVSRKEKTGDRFGLDRVGLVLYAGYAWTQCPLTLDYGILEREMQMAEVVADGTDARKQGTAIGSAVGLAVQRLSKSEAKSKVIILLTDGLNNRGELDPLTAAEVAKKYDTRIYTIGAGSTRAQRTGFFSQSQPIDEAMLTEIATRTGGKYYRATDLETLREAYREISALETTEIEAGDYYEYKKAFMPWLLLGALLTIGAIFARRKWFEAIP